MMQVLLTWSNLLLEKQPVFPSSFSLATLPFTTHHRFREKYIQLAT